MLDQLLQRFHRHDRNAFARLLTMVAQGERVDEIWSRRRRRQLSRPAWSR